MVHTRSLITVGPWRAASSSGGERRPEKSKPRPSYCGITGLRPTFGRVSRHGAMALAYSMDKIGPMGRTADDCALVLSAISGHDPIAPRFGARARRRQRARTPEAK
ncbi:MAG: hypothetical protein HY237_00615 [Acidobacteria bacterium]|nr:hypothetical protein [Acidobacteriota bacterium]